MKTFSVQTLGCKVNQYEGEQLAALLRARGLSPAEDPARADLRVVHTCSVTVPAAGKSRQAVRRAVRLTASAGQENRVVRLPVLAARESRVVLEPVDRAADGPAPPVAAAGAAVGGRQDAPCQTPHCDGTPMPPSLVNDGGTEPSAGSASRAGRRPKVVVTGCWATSDRKAAAAMPGVDAVLTHRDDVAAELDRLLALWREGETESRTPHAAPREITCEPLSEPLADDGWISKAGAPAGRLTQTSKASVDATVKENSIHAHAAGMTRLPMLGEHQAGRQRAFLKVQDGCDAHCTYCIIPKLRSTLWSKPLEGAVGEAKALVAAGHVEIVLTGIFLGAYGQPTALRRRQPAGAPQPIGELVAALCTRVPGLRRVRLSSLEPGDLTPELVAVLRDHPQVVPHFHLPLQSGSDRLLRRMNRQYSRDDFCRMVDLVGESFERPALTTDVIVGFPGETDEEFERTVEVCGRARFIHVHAFSFSPRPGTAAARWQADFVRGPVVNERIGHLNRLAADHSLAFRRQFLGETVELLVEAGDPAGSHRHGRSERYFEVTIPGEGVQTGDFVHAKVMRVSSEMTIGAVLA